MGWNSWNAYMVDISDSIIMNAADMMIAKGLKDAGYDHVNIDDGYFGYRDSAGYMIPHPERFPDGMAHVPEYIHSLGMKAGIYSDAGHSTCGSYYNVDKTTVSYLVALKKGSNVIRFGNPAETISVVDCMTLEKEN